MQSIKWFKVFLSSLSTGGENPSQFFLSAAMEECNKEGEKSEESERERRGVRDGV